MRRMFALRKQHTFAKHGCVELHAERAGCEEPLFHLTLAMCSEDALSIWAYPCNAAKKHVLFNFGLFTE
jgi:hypothetical protein